MGRGTLPTIPEGFDGSDQREPPSRWPACPWLAMAVAAVVFVSLALAAAKSGRLDGLLPKDRPFVPYFTT
jgi:hypothetical protein